MSYDLVDWVLKEGPTHSGDKLVLAVIASFVNSRSGRCDPSVPAIAERACMTVRGARQVIRRLEVRGWITVETGGGRADCNSYQINAERGSGFFGEYPERSSPFPDEKPGTEFHETRNVVPENPEPRSENPERGSPEPVRTKKRTEEGNPPRVRVDGAAQPPAADDAVLSDAAMASFRALFDRWPKRIGEADARGAFAEALSAGADLRAIAVGAAAYVADRYRDRRGPAAIIQFTTPLARWLRERGWETWQGLPEAERAAQHTAADEEEAARARARSRAALRAAMPF